MMRNLYFIFFIALIFVTPVKAQWDDFEVPPPPGFSTYCSDTVLSRNNYDPEWDGFGHPPLGSSYYYAVESVVFTSGFFHSANVSDGYYVLHAYIGPCQPEFNVDLRRFKTANNKNDTIDELIFYPNPNNGLFEINFAGVSTGDIRITDVKGSVVYQSDFEEKSTFKVDISNQNKGMYFMQVLLNGNYITRKIIKD